MSHQLLLATVPFTIILYNQNPSDTHKIMAQKYYLFIWASYILLAPAYVFKSGLPQPADFILLLGMLPCLALAFMNFEGRFRNIYIFGGLFTGLTLAINLTHFFFLPDFKFFLSSLFYIYNFLVFLFVVHIGIRYFPAFRRISHSCVLSIIAIEFIWVVFFDSTPGPRASGSFNNPNQLGYWALLSGCMLFVLRGRDSLNWADYGGLTLLSYIQALSLSKAATITFAFLLLMALISRLSRPGHKILLIILCLAGIAYTAHNIQTVQQITEIAALGERLDSIGTQSDDDLGQRGYTRLLSHPEYIIFGAGEGGFNRFPPTYSDKEIHSGLATILFSYGIVGAGFFGIFLFFVFRRTLWVHSALLLPIMAYGLTHQNVRNTYFWVFLATVYVMKEISMRQNIPPTLGQASPQNRSHPNQPWRSHSRSNL